jgi:outer membrane receptor protein involved in Fe transport
MPRGTGRGGVACGWRTGAAPISAVPVAAAPAAAAAAEAAPATTAVAVTDGPLRSGGTRREGAQRTPAQRATPTVDDLLNSRADRARPRRPRGGAARSAV